jgi:hypothetical protein
LEAVEIGANLLQRLPVLFLEPEVHFPGPFP